MNKAPMVLIRTATGERKWITVEAAQAIADHDPIRHGTLPEEMRQAIGYIRKVFGLVKPLSQKDWEIGFQQDRDPDIEVALWLRMALAYEQYFRDRPHTKGDAIKVLSVLKARVSSDDPFAIMKSLGDGYDAVMVSEVCDLYISVAGNVPPPMPPTLPPRPKGRDEQTG